MSFGCYEVGETIGRGASSKVKIAKHVLAGPNHPVAFKVISKSYVLNSPEGRLEQNALTEIAIMKKLDHPHIVKLYEAIQTRRDLVLVMEYFEGGELLDYITGQNKLNEQTARSLFQQIVAAVEHCHLHGVVHRDLKPENLLLSGDHRVVKLADFGLSATLHDGRCLSASCGSPNYSAPEVFEGQCYGAEVDLWSLGVVLYTMVSGRLPFDSDHMSELKQQVVTAVYEMPRFLSNECKDLLRRLLVVDPLQRATIHQIKEHAWLKPHFPLYLLRINEDVIGRARVSQALRGLKNPEMCMSPGVVGRNHHGDLMRNTSTSVLGAGAGAAPFGKSPIQPPETKSILLNNDRRITRASAHASTNSSRLLRPVVDHVDFGVTPQAHLVIGDSIGFSEPHDDHDARAVKELSRGPAEDEDEGKYDHVAAPKLSAVDELVVSLLFYSPVNATEGGNSSSLLDQRLVEHLLRRSKWFPLLLLAAEVKKGESHHSGGGAAATPAGIQHEVEEKERLYSELKSHFEAERYFREQLTPMSLEAAATTKGGIPFADPLLNKHEHTLWVGYDILAHHRAMRNPMLLESLAEAANNAPMKPLSAATAAGSMSRSSLMVDRQGTTRFVDPTVTTTATQSIPVGRQRSSHGSPTAAGADSFGESALTLGYSERRNTISSPTSPNATGPLGGGGSLQQGFGVQFPIQAVPASPGLRGSRDNNSRNRGHLGDHHQHLARLQHASAPDLHQQGEVGGMASGPNSFATFGASAPMEHNGLNVPLGASYGMLRQVGTLAAPSPTQRRTTFQPVPNSNDDVGGLQQHTNNNNNNGLDSTQQWKGSGAQGDGDTFSLYSLHRTQRQTRMSSLLTEERRINLVRSFSSGGLFSANTRGAGAGKTAGGGSGRLSTGLSSHELGSLINLNNQEVFGVSIDLQPPARRHHPLPQVNDAGAAMGSSVGDRSHSGSPSNAAAGPQHRQSPPPQPHEEDNVSGVGVDDDDADYLVLPRGVMRLGMLLSETPETVTAGEGTPTGAAQNSGDSRGLRAAPRTPKAIMNIIYDALQAEAMLWKNGREGPFSLIALAPNGKGKIFVAVYRTVVARPPAEETSILQGHHGIAGGSREDEEDRCFVIDLRISRYGGIALLDATAALYRRLLSLAHVDVVVSHHPTTTSGESPEHGGYAVVVAYPQDTTNSTPHHHLDIFPAAVVVGTQKIVANTTAAIITPLPSAVAGPSVHAVGADDEEDLET